MKLIFHIALITGGFFNEDFIRRIKGCIVQHHGKLEYGSPKKANMEESIILNYADTVDDGIVVCGYRMKDMMYTQLREYLPDSFEMLLIASQDKWSSGDVEGIVGLSTPIKVYDFMNTMNMMLQSMDRKRKKRKKESKNRDPKQQEMIRRAKELLMERNNMSEGEAHRYLQKNSMDSGTNMVETAEMVLSIMAE